MSALEVIAVICKVMIEFDKLVELFLDARILHAFVVEVFKTIFAFL